MDNCNTRSPFYKGDLICLVGLPLSGKSTHAEKLAQADKKVAVVCPDTIRLALHGNQFIGLAEPFIWATAQIMARTLLKQGYTVVIDATNTTAERRKMWRYLAKEFNKDFIIHHIDTATDECRRRNKEINRLDEAIIDRMEKQFEPPRSDEGFVFTQAEVERYLWVMDIPKLRPELPGFN